MSREIKFRYWDIINETMIEDAHLLDSLNEKIARPREYHVMQYTGLKDKDGVEIYEGDIVKLTEEYGPTQKGKIATENFAVEFVVDEVSFQLDHTSGLLNLGGHHLPLLLTMGKGEVIGDIYQNPKLLGEQNESEKRS